MLIYSFMFFFGMFSFLMNRKHLLSMLLSMEFLILVLFMYMYMYLNFYFYELYFVMIFLTMSVCESVMGLALLVSMIYSFGNDYFNSLNVLW
uniref:NADH-ubiquinone oxidoreductase chain 4L n=1 Tax=Cycloneda sanguinea TaxID=633097 RepID=A0A173GHH9_9CUCU|nr:NADH dehydrogenase subunit 4L [Cycloneda sanguinea]